MVTLRPYQQSAVQAVYDFFATQDGNPLIVLPTGAGKSLTLAAFIKGALEQYPTTRIIVLTHVKELIIQDVSAIKRYWPEAPVGVWSAGVGKKEQAQITVAGIQSIHRLPATFAGTDLVLIDEAHLLSKNSDTMYGRFIAGLKSYAPHLKVIGLTATPYRMDSGLLIDGKERIFTDIAYEAEVGQLINDGFLCPLVAKNGVTKADLSDVHTRGGEYIESELQDAMDKDELIDGALNEIAQYAHDREHVLGFCTGIEHSRRCAEFAQARGWTADYVTGEMNATERDAKINAFKSGKTRYLFNAMLLTTGFDFPSIDCIVLLRPTKSTGLYVQTLGRGLRNDGKKANTLVLDFAGNIERHGPIDQIKIKKKRGKSEISVAPVKECSNCHELVTVSVRECPGCGHLFPEPERETHGTEAADGVIVAAMKHEPIWRPVSDTLYRIHRKADRPPTLRVTYFSGLKTYEEFVPIEDPRPFVRKHAVTWFWRRGMMCPKTVDEAYKVSCVGRIPAPVKILVRPDGKYWKVVDIELDEEQALRGAVR